MGAGQLSERVRVERRARVSDGAGNTRAGWEPLPGGGVERWASLAMTSIRAGEQVLAGRLTATAPFDLLLRRDPGTLAVTQADRVVDVRAGTSFAIRSIGRCDDRKSPDGRGNHLLMQLVAGGADD